jgi:hypothetical protein
MGDVDWIDLAQDRKRWRALLNLVLKLRFPQNVEKLSSGLVIGGISSSAQLHRVSLFVAYQVTFGAVSTTVVLVRSEICKGCYE